MKRSCIALLLAVAIMLSIVACSTNAPVATTPAPAATENVPVPEPEPVPDAETAKMAPGTYSATAWGYNRVQPLEVSVTVSEDAILSVDVNLKNEYETSIKLQNAAELLAPRMVQEQSVTVDTIAGATASSAGIRMAATDAVKQALVAGGSKEGDIKTYQKMEKPEAKAETIETDVVVVGMGGSGSYAALRAAEQLYEKAPDDVKVLAIDKAGNYGGTTVLTGEALSVNPPEFQAEHNGGEDYVDADILYQDWLTYTEGDAKADMVKLMMDESGNALDWLSKNGFAFEAPQTGLADAASDAPEFVVKYRFAPVGEGGYISKLDFQKCFDSLFEKYNNYGGEYMLETEATELLYDSATNAVTGVMAYNKVTNTTYTINSKAVIIATGGFAGSGDMTTKYLSNDIYPLSGRWNVCGSMQNDGKMIKSAIDIGAGTYNIGMTPVCHLFGPDGWLTSYPNVPLDGEMTVYHNKPAMWSEGDLPMMLLFWDKTFAVNSLGKRFLPENNLASFDAWQGGPDISVIVTEAQMKEIAEQGLNMGEPSMHLLLNMDILNGKAPIPSGTILPNALQVMEDGVKAGFISKADTIEDLAKDLGLDPQVLSAEMAQYNSACATGVDEALGKPAESLISMEAGPYYAIHAGMYCYGTCAGLDINADFNVLQADGKTPIGGLYAVGADGQGVIYSDKKAYVTYGGADNGWAIMSGYMAGEKAVAALK